MSYQEIFFNNFSFFYCLVVILIVLVGYVLFRVLLSALKFDVYVDFEGERDWNFLVVGKNEIKWFLDEELCNKILTMRSKNDGKKAKRKSGKRK